MVYLAEGVGCLKNENWKDTWFWMGPENALVMCQSVAVAGSA